MMATESEAVEAEEEKIEEKQEEEIVVAECNWAKGRSYSVKTFKKSTSHFAQAASRFVSLKITPTSHKYGGYNMEAF